MEPKFSGFLTDPSKCSELSLEEKRDLVHEVSQCTENALKILQSFSRPELLQLICAELGEEIKYSGVTKPKLIAHLLKLVSEKKNSNQNGAKRKRKKENLIQFSNNDISKMEQVHSVICKNVACQAPLKQEDQYCKKCSCCICYQYDDNKDPSLWLVCSSDRPYCGESCGISCHLKCALKNEKTGIIKIGCCGKLDGSFYCVCCGKLNWLIGSWRKQLQIAKKARRVDILCDRLLLSHKILKDTEKYKELHKIVSEAVKKIKKELGPLDKVSIVMARGIVNRLACGAEVQMLCASALDALDSILSSSFDGMIENSNHKIPAIISSLSSPFFEITVQKSFCPPGTCKPKMPIEFYNCYWNKKVAVVLLKYNGVHWPATFAKVRSKTSHLIEMVEGWSNFCLGNGLIVGSVVIFEMIGINIFLIHII